MAVLEICQLQIKVNVSTDDPSVLKSLVEVRSLLKAKVYNTKSRFYQCLEDPTLVYIFGEWPTISAHHDFLASDVKSEILSPQDDLLDFNWVMHMPLVGVESLPLNAPVISFTRFLAKGGDQQPQLQSMFDDYGRKITKDSNEFKMAGGWRCDSLPGMREALTIGGWESQEAHEQFNTQSTGGREYASLNVLCDTVEVRHLKPMEV